MERKLIANPIVPDGEVWVSPKTWDDPFTKGKVAASSTSTNKTQPKISQEIIESLNSIRDLFNEADVCHEDTVSLYQNNIDYCIAKLSGGA